MVKYTAFALLLSLAIISQACSSSPLDSYKAEGQSIIRSLVKDLQTAHTREQLLAISPQLKKLFNKLSAVMIRAREEQLHGKQSREGSAIDDASLDDTLLSDQLKEELNRLYHIDGCRDIIENCQKEALNRLDQFEQKMRK